MLHVNSVRSSYGQVHKAKHSPVCNSIAAILNPFKDIIAPVLSCEFGHKTNEQSLKLTGDVC